MLRLTVLLIAIPLLAAPVPKDATPLKLPPNTNALLKAHAGKLTFDASTVFGNWPIEKLFDGNEQTSWYSGSGDHPTAGKQPWVRVTFEQDVTVRRVTILGNREPQYPNGYSVLAGYFEFLNSDGTVIHKAELTAQGEKHDFELELRLPLSNVRAIRFTGTKDQNQQTCIGLAEMQVE